MNENTDRPENPFDRIRNKIAAWALPIAAVILVIVILTR